MDDMKFAEHITSGYNKQIFKKYNSIRKGASIRNMIFDLSFKEYLPFYNQPCCYCGSTDRNGLDRLDSSMGYKKGNIVSCCTTCNIMKSTLDPRDFVFQCNKISKYCVSIPEYHQNNTYTLLTKTHIQSIQEHEKEMLRESLNRHKGNRTWASRELGISTTTMWRKMKKYGIEATISH